MGHRDLLVTHTNISAVRQPPLRTSHAKRPPLGGYVQTRYSTSTIHFSANPATHQMKLVSPRQLPISRPIRKNGIHQSACPVLIKVFVAGLHYIAVFFLRVIPPVGFPAVGVGE